MKKEKLIGIYNRISEEELKKVKIKMAKRRLKNRRIIIQEWLEKC